MKTKPVFARVIIFFAAMALGAPGDVCAGGSSPADAVYITKVAAGETPAAALPEGDGPTGWWARSWTETDGSGFHGRPERRSVTTSEDHITVRYTRFTVEYNVVLHSPVWVAYTLGPPAIENEARLDRPASDPEFARPGRFFQEPLIVNRSAQLGVPAASHGTFTSTVDPRYPVVQAGRSITAAAARKINGDRAIQRGHLVPNNAMKYQGSHEEGQTAQLESFSVANIVPQMAKSNAPTWYALESACFDWARELGQVWLVVGPVYHDRAHPTYIRKVKGGRQEILPSPDELFYVVIGKRNGKWSAVGFLLPHQPTIIDFKLRAVAVDVIESQTGLNFMPDLGEPNALETRFDSSWLKTRRRSNAGSDEN